MDITEAMERIMVGETVGVVRPDLGKFVDYIEVAMIDGELYERRVFRDGDCDEFSKSRMELATFLTSDFVDFVRV